MDIEIDVTLPHPVDRVWAAAADIADHVNWMADAEKIRFLTDRRSGVGTRFECLTAVGPLHTTDLMEITRWEEERLIGVRHRGLVTGEGVFVLEPLGRHTTRFRWHETLSLPWWYGGPAGELVARPVLATVWRRNLRSFRTHLAHREG
ncbi:MAG: SRPBCC family protein [Acidimicrobiales bacterium]